MANEWTMPGLERPLPREHPVIACTPAELDRLRSAFSAKGPAHDLVAAEIEAAQTALGEPIEFPPRGGQHNQWYQCDKCQLGLETVDDTHHRCRGCGTVYTGEPYDDVIFSRKHGTNLGNARKAAWAYAITGDRRFARYSAEVLLGYADRYLEYPYHNARLGADGTSGGHIFEQTLTEASICAGNIAPAYDLIHDSGVLSATEHRRIREGLILPMLGNIDRRKSKKSNWQTWHNAAFITGGAVIGEASWIEKALTQEENGFGFQMEQCVSEDGMWYENSWGYHFYTLRAMVIIVESARRLGIDLWSHPKLKAMFTLPVSYAMADGSLPRFGDDVSSSVRSGADPLEAAYQAYGDPQMLAFLSKEPTWRSILYGRSPAGTQKNPGETAKGMTGSAVFPNSGHAILRTRGPAGITAALTFSPYGGFHGHFDKLSFVLFGFETELGVDPGRARSQAYRLPIHREWYRSTLSHNAVLVDGVAQKPAAGFPESFGANARYAGAVAGCSEAYADVDHRRLLLLTPDYALVFDALRSADGERRFEWLYHNRGTAVSCDAAAEPADLSGATNGLQYVRDASQGVAEGAIRALFEADEVAAHVTLAGDGRTEIVTGTGPGASILDRIPLVMFARSGEEACFAASIEPVRTGEEASIRRVGHTMEGEVHVIVVERRGKTETVLLSPDGTFEVLSNGRRVLASRSF